MSDENKDFKNEETESSESTEFVILEESSDKNDSLPPLNSDISDNPEEIRERIIKSTIQAEEEIREELNASSDELKPQKNNEVEKIKRQNFLLKVICGCLIACTAVNVFLAIPKSNKSNLYISDSEVNKVVLTNVDQGERLSASQIHQENINSIVAIHTETITQSIFGSGAVSAGSGSGFIISENGYILTNYHVIEDVTNINVVTANGKEYSAKVIGYEADNDIAVLKLDTEEVFKPVVFGKSENIVVGEEVVAIGNPLGELTFSITKGIVSAVDRNIQIDNITAIGMLQVDCAVNQGNSGGPIFNMYGEVVGIVSAKYASELIEGLGFCIPIDDAVEILPDLIEYGKVMNKSYMGIVVANVTSDMVTQYNMVNGAYVTNVDSDSCAERAGLKVGDIIVQLGDEEVSNVSELLAAKRDYKAEETASLKIWRGGEYINLNITFDEYVEVEEPVVDSNQNNLPQGTYPSVPNQDSVLEDFLWEYFFGNR